MATIEEDYVGFETAFGMYLTYKFVEDN